ncbi:Uncharacterised protein [Corynebacterium jeikeium]|uniref:Putative membrane protein n=1 Tax=Corynebacterium jeikeium (strain K411) TaxID=306537 RepID=Q4JXU8_CORJK|nr:hypothetical protein [Corynebacterium jeikeium]CAI36359.1 putative membrane protein [Corynebacterium jeikeium K411]SUY84069.1 Uncharacterised protein [Corynebacterium jeikeium]
MTRRIFSILSVVGMVLAMSRVVDLFTPQQLQNIAGVFFAGLVVLQLWPLVATQRNSYGHRRHPVNRLYTLMGSVGLVGTTLLVVVFYLHSPIWLIVIAGSLMIVGIVGAAVLALFAAPWDDWSTRRGRDVDDELFLRDDEPVEDVWDKSFRT